MSDDRPCTCPPMERPHPCARKFALSECKAATVMDPICYRWRHQKDEVWKYGHQPQHLVPPRGKEVIGYYIVQPLYTADALAAAREEGRQAGLEEAAIRCRDMCDKCGGAGWVYGTELDEACEDTRNDSMTHYSCDGFGCDCADAIRALIDREVSDE